MRCLVHLVGVDRLVQCQLIGSPTCAVAIPRTQYTSVYNANLMTSVMRPDPRYELALASQVPYIQTEHPDTSAVAVTLFPPTL